MVMEVEQVSITTLLMQPGALIPEVMEELTEVQVMDGQVMWEVAEAVQSEP